MHPYPATTRLKLGLIVAAVAIAVASLAFTRHLAAQLEAQDERAVELWVEALRFVYAAGAEAEARDAALYDDLAAALAAADVPAAERARLGAALDTLRDGGAGPDGLDFVFSQIVEPDRFSVPAVVTDTARSFVTASRNVEAEGDAALALVPALAAVHDPILIAEAPGDPQLVHYGESPLARLIRAFPVVQLGVVGLFVLVGYLGFQTARRSEQSSLWVGMAKEAAHQLGTPLSSMVGWIELLRLGDALPPAEIADELERDADRLRRVADRFEKIGSTPSLEPTALGPVLDGVAGYVRRRVPQLGPPVTIAVDVPPGLGARLNAELFEWVVENLLKNALDALDGVPGPHAIAIRGRREGGRAVVEVQDTGKGMDRATARHVFRPGFSTKRRGWGLGLSLARRIVEAYHGGALSVAETRPGHGTTFRIELDAAEMPEREPAEAAAAR